MEPTRAVVVLLIEANNYQPNGLNAVGDEITTWAWRDALLNHFDALQEVTPISATTDPKTIAFIESLLERG